MEYLPARLITPTSSKPTRWTPRYSRFCACMRGLSCGVCRCARQVLILSVGKSLCPSDLRLRLPGPVLCFFILAFAFSFYSSVPCIHFLLLIFFMLSRLHFFARTGCSGPPARRPRAPERLAQVAVFVCSGCLLPAECMHASY
jgi:hypothetical protein